MTDSASSDESPDLLSTKRNAFWLLWAMAKKMQWKRIIIVTDEFHTRRALLGFERVFQDSGLEVQVAGAANEIFDSGNWWKSDRGILAYLNEAIKYPVYLIWRQEPTLVRND